MYFGGNFVKMIGSDCRVEVIIFGSWVLIGQKNCSPQQLLINFEFFVCHGWKFDMCVSCG
jgi:hypothetical protein